MHPMQAPIRHHHRFGADDAVVLGSDAGQALPTLHRLGNRCSDRGEMRVAAHECGYRYQVLELSPLRHHSGIAPQRLHEQPVVGHAIEFRRPGKWFGAARAAVWVCKGHRGLDSFLLRPLVGTCERAVLSDRSPRCATARWHFFGKEEVHFSTAVATQIRGGRPSRGRSPSAGLLGVTAMAAAQGPVEAPARHPPCPMGRCRCRI